MLRLVKLSDSPEQHEVWLGEAQVGYVRLLRGTLQVMCPNSRGKEVLTVVVGHEMKFHDQRERSRWLGAALKRINRWVECRDKEAAAS
jgi:hypothetical protein